MWDDKREHMATPKTAQGMGTCMHCGVWITWVAARDGWEHIGANGRTWMACSK